MDRPDQGQGPNVGRRGDAAARRKEDSVAIATINPATGETLKTFDELSEAEVERRLAAAAAASAATA